MILAAALLMQPVSLDSPVSLESIETYAREAFDRTPTQCDALIAHPSDPERVGEGVSRADADLPAAILACTDAVEADPGNPRLNYQLARAYGYSGLHEEGQPYRDAALRAGYPQSLFVVGYIRVENWDGRGADPCYGGELIRRSAHAGRYAGLVGFPHYALMGVFDACGAVPAVDTAEMLGFLDEAEARSSDYYQGLLVDQLRARLIE
ncbi:MAG: hypothetical protein RIA71_04645 [Oceanicaulis sp.]